MQHELWWPTGDQLVAVFAWRGADWSVLGCVGDRRCDLDWVLIGGGIPGISGS